MNTAAASEVQAQSLNIVTVWIHQPSYPCVLCVVPSICYLFGLAGFNCHQCLSFQGSVCNCISMHSCLPFRLVLACRFFLHGCFVFRRIDVRVSSCSYTYQDGKHVRRAHMHISMCCCVMLCLHDYTNPEAHVKTLHMSIHL